MINRKNLILIPVTTQIRDSAPGNFKIFSVKEDELNLVDSCRCKMLILLSWLDIKKIILSRLGMKSSSSAHDLTDSDEPYRLQQRYIP